jgi:nucleoside-diphosphate-sugar epimerase
MKVLVIGGTQFNGLALVHELARAGHDVTVLNRGRSAAALPDSVHRLVADRSEPDTMRAALAGTEWDCVQDMTAYHPGDVELMVELLRDRVGHYVFASSTVTYASADILPITEHHRDDRTEAQNEYGMHKLLCEDLLFAAHAEFGFPVTSVPFSMVFGPHNSLPDREQRMFVRMLTGRPVLIPGDGTTLGQIGHVDDQARALEQMMGKAITLGKRYNLTGGEYYSDNGYVDTFAAVLGVEIERVNVPHPLMHALWDGEIDIDLGGGFSARMDIRSSGSPRGARQVETARKFALTRLIQRLAPNLHRWNTSVIFSIDRLRRDIGWEPQHGFVSAVEHTYDWFCREGLDKTLQPDFSFEDRLLELIATRA